MSHPIIRVLVSDDKNGRRDGFTLCQISRVHSGTASLKLLEDKIMQKILNKFVKCS